MESAGSALTCVSILKFKVLSNPLNLEKHSGVEAVGRQMETPPLTWHPSAWATTYWYFCGFVQEAVGDSKDIVTSNTQALSSVLWAFLFYVFI